MNKLINVFNKIENLLAGIAGILILFSMLSTVSEVFVRYFFNYSIVWIQEYNEYILLYIPFLAGAWLLRINGHVTVDLIDNFISSKTKKHLGRIVPIIGIITMFIIVYASVLVTVEAYKENLTSTTILNTPQFYVYIVIPIGAILMLFEFCRKLISVEEKKSN